MAEARQSAEKDRPEEHGYGDESDCTCGRNFRTVRGLREHLTKSRRVLPPEQPHDPTQPTNENGA